MQNIKDQIRRTKDLLDTSFVRVKTIKDLDVLRVHLLGKKGIITELLAEIKNLSLENKKEFGPLIYQLKTAAEDMFVQTKQQLNLQSAHAENNKMQYFDVTAVLPAQQIGYLHPYSQFVEEIQNIFMSMGYEVMDGRELETEEYNFTGLNIPKDHPARDMQDTFWVDQAKGLLMRTHTSTMQIHAMKNRPLPLAIVSPGRTYRQEATDASHDFMFMQCEGFFVDKNISLAHLFGTAQTFLKKLFNKDSLDIRIRPGFFPFVEPGVEIDMRCPFCKNGCSVCKKSTWIEVFPAGLIHPNVLKYCGVDPEVYSGFAFGFGLTRLVMLKYGIDDIRFLLNGKIKFIEQF
jgi:phenylalanyl-tRNA synthetase alpha chain